MSTGQRIKDLRIERGLTQVELAFSANVSKQTMYKYENDIITNIPSDKIEAIAEALYTTPAYLMEWEDDPHDWERIGNDEGIYPPKDYNGSYEDFVKFKVYEQQDSLCDNYWDLLEEAIGYLKSIRCRVSESKTPRITKIITPDGQSFEISDDVLVHNYMTFGASKPGIKKLITPILNMDLRFDEQQILNSYNQLNNNGRIEAKKRIRELTMIPSYTMDENDENQVLNAAHNAGATEEQKKQADDIMMDDSEWE